MGRSARLISCRRQNPTNGDRLHGFLSYCAACLGDEASVHVCRFEHEPLHYRDNGSCDVQLIGSSSNHDAITTGSRHVVQQGSERPPPQAWGFDVAEGELWEDEEEEGGLEEPW